MVAIFLSALAIVQIDQHVRQILVQSALNVIRVLLGLATVGLLGLRLRLLLWLVLGMGLLMGTGRL